MSRPMRIEFPGAVYHITSRGIDRRPIFRTDADRRLLGDILCRVVGRWRWIVHAYCLMGNHYHLLIETPEPNLSRGMRHLNGDYSQAFNRRHLRSGHLFQGRFKGLLVEKQSHLLELCRYVVLNPVRSRMIGIHEPGEWEWSSYRATAGLGTCELFLHTDWILRQFHGTIPTARNAYVKFVSAGMARESGKGIETHKGLWIGTEQYGKSLEGYLAPKREVQEFRMVERHAVRPTLESYFPPNFKRDKTIRDQGIARAYSEGRYTQREIARKLGLHYVTISVIVRRMEKRIGDKD